MDLPIKCSECGAILDGDMDNLGNLEVDLCPKCEERIREEAHQKGYQEA